jgi:hypothetical protein
MPPNAREVGVVTTLAILSHNVHARCLKYTFMYQNQWRDGTALDAFSSRTASRNALPRFAVIATNWFGFPAQSFGSCIYHQAFIALVRNFA